PASRTTTTWCSTCRGCRSRRRRTSSSTPCGASRHAPPRRSGRPPAPRPSRAPRNDPEEATMSAATELFEIGQEGGALVLTPTENLRELDYPEIDAAAEAVFDRVRDARVEGVVVDWSRADYCGSTALGFLAKLWLRLRRRDGRLAFCNVSDH